MDKDRLINLLPEEYLPEPEFKAFPIFAAALIILTILFIWFQYQTDDKMVRTAKQQAEEIEARNLGYIADAEAFLEIQANARFIRSYMAIVPDIVQQAPDYWAIYNEVEENLPENTWVQSMSFRGATGKKWPTLSVSFLSRGYSFTGPLATYDNFLGTTSRTTRFKNLRMGGYRRASVGGYPGASFEILMDIRKPYEASLLAE